MSAIHAELTDLEAELRYTFEQEDWSLSLDEAPVVMPAGGTTRGINMDLGTLGGGRPRPN